MSRVGGEQKGDINNTKFNSILQDLGKKTEITLAEFHCMINIAETNYLK